MKESWVQDANIKDVSSIIMDMTERNAEYIQNTGSKYMTGPSKSGKHNYVGIYFRDPIGICDYDHNCDKEKIKEI